MVEMATYYFVIENVMSETLQYKKENERKHSNFLFTVPLPKKSEGLSKEPGALGIISSMLTAESHQKICKEGKFGSFERDREEFRKLKFRTFDITHFAFQILVEESLRKFEEFASIKFLTTLRNSKSNQQPKASEFFKKAIARPPMESLKKFYDMREKEILNVVERRPKQSTKDAIKQQKLFYFVNVFT